jgi:hypothetical protein
VNRPRQPLLRSFVDDVRGLRRRARRRRSVSTPPARTDDQIGDELARRLDETRERLRRDIPPRSDV